ncbi:MAG: cobalamin-dependent protein [Desulfobacterales bacterium]|nr:cobalamin-dependent protein [Desulfobacterales bacterium]
MKIKLIYPKWEKLKHQTEFHLPPHGPVVFASTVPENIDLEFEDENVQTLNFDNSCDLIAISVMLTCQLPRAFEIADKYRELGIPVIFGGIATMLHSEEVLKHSDSVFIGESEGRFKSVLDDFKNGKLKKIYNYLNHHPDINIVESARRDILKRDLYNYRGVQMLDLVHASRGCRFNCFPCSTRYLGGNKFRPRPISKVIHEMEQIANNRLFIVDNSLAQDRQWVMDLFKEMIPLKKKWVSHPILDDNEVLKLAAMAGCWYVYQAIFDTSDVIRNRVKRLKDHGIGVEGTILLGTDNHDEDYIKRLIDFSIEIEIDIAEFTILTPFAHTPIRNNLEKEGRIIDNNLKNYTCDKVVFLPKNMSPEKLYEMYDYSWDTFYKNSGHQIKMADLFMRVIKKEVEDGTYRRYNPRKRRTFK